jgi:conjugal transfer pilus assembly protein TraV
MTGRPLAPWPLPLGAALLLGACTTNMSGLSGSSSYACKAPDGVACDSVSGTYANAVQHNLPSQRAKPAVASASAAAASPAPVPRATMARAAPPALSSTALRSSPRVLRLWFRPWEDADRDLYDQGYVYVQIDSGRWLMDHVQRQAREGQAKLRPPPRAAVDQKDGAAASASPGSSTRPVPGGLPLGPVPSSVRSDGSD